MKTQIAPLAPNGAFFIAVVFKKIKKGQRYDPPSK